MANSEAWYLFGRLQVLFTLYYFTSTAWVKYIVRVSSYVSFEIGVNRSWKPKTRKKLKNGKKPKKPKKMKVD